MTLMVVGAIFAVVSTGILQKVCQIIPTPFIDEIFHIPQAQQYCNGSFEEWNNKITTPPGLYFSSLLLQLPLFLISRQVFCSVIALRAVNVVLNTINLFLIYDIMNELRHSRKTTHGKEEKEDAGQSDDTILKIQAISLAIFPVNYLFSFLYYTDPGSVMFVLAAYLANLKSMHKTSAFLGLLSVFFRQTNIVWVIFLAGCTVAKEMVKAEAIRKIEASPEIKDKLVRFLVGIVSAAVKYLLVISNLLQIFKLIWPYICVFLMFAGFIFINGSIVLGDKQNHEATFHAPQILYYFAFTLFFSSPILLSFSLVERFVGAVLKNPKKFAVFAAVFLYMIINYSVIHIYLLSDNRHYTFYLCRHLLRYPLFRILLTPVYIYAGWAINQVLERPNCTGIWKLVFLVCTCAVTIPQRLIEVRYFIIPYLIFRMNAHVTKYYHVIIEFLLYLLINIFTLYVFFTKEFEWDDVDEPQRIIW